MNKKSKYLEKLLEVQNEHQRMMNQIVANVMHEQEELINKLHEEESNIHCTLGEKVADKVASFGGSWAFIFIFFMIIISWMCYNNALENKAFDAYPFILLNLVLSCLAALQAPVILMSQNRKESRDRKRAQDDYLINLKSELENRAMDQKLDLFINEQFKELIEIQKVQIAQLENLEKMVKKTHPIAKTL